MQTKLPMVVGRRPAAEWRKLVEEYERSGETLPQFSARYGISRTSIEYWRRKLQGSPTRSGEAFREYRLEAVGAARGEVEVRLSNGKSLLVRGDVCEQTLRQLLTILE